MLRHLVESLRRELGEDVEPFGKANIEKLRKDFLTLMKNVDRVQNYDQAFELKTAFSIWRERFNDLMYERLIPFLKDHIRQAAPAHVRADWDNDTWKGIIASWDKKLRKETWDLYIELSLPLRHTDDYWSKEMSYSRFEQDKDKWAAKIRREAQGAWKVLNDYFDWLKMQGEGGHEKVTIKRPSLERVVFNGFQVEMFGYTGAEKWENDGVDALKRGLDLYRKRMGRVYPWAVQHMLPVRLDFHAGLDYGGRYERDHILISPLGISSYKAEYVVHVLAHEMGHHIWSKHISPHAAEFWNAAIHGDYKDLDLRHLADMWKRLAPSGTVYDLENHVGLMERDPVLLLQLQGLTSGYDRSQQSFFRLSELEELIAGGVSHLKVPAHPITAYATKNSEEAFCEAFGMLVGFGPQVVLPQVRQWLQTILPQIHVESRTRSGGALCE